VRSFGFLLSRRWVLFGAAVLVVAYVTWWLGNWQFSRLEERRDANAVVQLNESREPAPVAEVMPPGGELAADDVVAAHREQQHVEAVLAERARHAVAAALVHRARAPGHAFVEEQ
jgi:cytochrome oxidase assembly protein ShyY1